MSTAITDLTADCQYCEFTLGEYKFEVEAFEALDLLQEIDVKHRKDPITCLECQATFTKPEDIPNPDDTAKPLKGCLCGSKKLYYPQDYLDDVVSLLKSRYKVPRCGRTEARLFYLKIVEVTEKAKPELKKNTSPTAELDTGITSTPEPGRLL